MAAMFTSFSGKGGRGTMELSIEKMFNFISKKFYMKLERWIVIVIGCWVLQFLCE